MARGREAGHVEADLGDEDAGDGLADARHRDQVVEGGAKGGQGFAQARLHLAHGGLERLLARAHREEYPSLAAWVQAVLEREGKG